MEIGLSKSTPTAWKKRQLTPQGETLNKIASYFDVSVDHLLGTTSLSVFSQNALSREELTFALFGELSPDITDDMLEEVKRYAHFIRKERLSV